MEARREAFGWEFGNAPEADGWYAVKQLDPLVASTGSLLGRIRGVDPYMRSPLINVPARYTQIEIRMKIEPAAVSAFKVYFVTEGDPHWDESKAVRFPVLADGEYHVYQVDMSAVPGWQGQIRQLRLDPKESAGWFEVDYIRMTGGRDS
jgi:hypothetical protein